MNERLKRRVTAVMCWAVPVSFAALLVLSSGCEVELIPIGPDGGGNGGPADLGQASDTTVADTTVADTTVTDSAVADTAVTDTDGEMGGSDDMIVADMDTQPPAPVTPLDYEVITPTTEHGMGARLGFSVSQSGDTLVAGAPQNTGPGVVYAFTGGPGAWAESLVIDAFDVSETAPEDDNFGAAVSIDGSYLGVADSGIGMGGMSHFYAFDISDTLAEEVTTSNGHMLEMPPSVAVSGNQLVIGIPAGDQAFFYDFSDQTTSSDNYDGTMVGFGAAVAADGANALVGSPGAMPGGVRSGLVRFYVDQDQDGLDRVPDGAVMGDSIGLAVALDGDWAVVGAPEAEGGGQVHIYRHDGDEWSYDQTLDGPDESVEFGRSVSIDGLHLVVGDPGFNGDQGIVRMYEEMAAEFNLIETSLPTELAAGDRFGWSVHVGEDQVLVGAPNSDTNGDDSGAVYLLWWCPRGSHGPGCQHTCGDNSQNGHEADEDCGGGVCPPCGSGATCTVPADCEMPLMCVGMTCQ